MFWDSSAIIPLCVDEPRTKVIKDIVKMAKRDEYNKNKYHKPSDEYDPNWDLSGAIEDLQLLFKIGYRLSMESSFPNWKEGSEFKAKRDADMANKK